MHDIHWFKSTFSDDIGNCVEMAGLPDGVGVRDSKDPDGAVLHFTTAEFAAWVAGAKAGQYDHLI